MAPGACSTESNNRWDVTCIQRAQSEAAESVDFSGAVLFCVAPCFYTSLRQKASCKHIILQLAGAVWPLMPMSPGTGWMVCWATLAEVSSHCTVLGELDGSWFNK